MCKVLLTFIGIVGSVSLVIILYFVLIKQNDESICLTNDCKLTAAMLISAMDSSVDPCQDFYKFTCANFIRTNPVPNNKLRVTTFEQNLDTINIQLKNLIENYNPSEEPDLVYRAIQSYHLCKNTNKNPKKELKAFKEGLIDVMGGWPMAMGPKWKSRYINLTNFFATLLLYDYPYILFDIYFNHIEWDFNKKRDIFIPGFYVIFDSLEFNSESLFYFDEEDIKKIDNEKGNQQMDNKLKARISAIMKFLKLFGSPSIFPVITDIKQLVKLNSFTSQRLIDMPLNEDLINMTVKEMNDQSNLNWLEIIAAKFPNEARYLTLNTRIAVKYANGLKHLSMIFNKFHIRELTNMYISNVMTYHFMTWFAIPDMMKIFTDYMEESTGQKFRPHERWEFCLQVVRRDYMMVLVRMFIKEIVGKNGKRSVDEMVQMIQKAYRQKILDSEWLDDQTKERAVRKADSIRSVVAYSESMLNDEIFKEIYRSMPAVRSTWFWEVWIRQNNSINLNKIYKWHKDSFEFNAQYILNENSVWFPVVLLQLPLFKESRSAAVNFGMIGFLIGHELGHAFDSDGSQYNEKGRKEMWWTKFTRKNFEKRSECFVNQYNSYCSEIIQEKKKKRVCVNGKSTLAENLADNTGLNAALDAYHLWTEKYGEEQRLPGLEIYSPEQIFFLSFGYIRCENWPDKWLDWFGHEYYVHSPEEYRVNGALSNNMKFRKAFNCPEGPMNRERNTCVLWGE